MGTQESASGLKGLERHGVVGHRHLQSRYMTILYALALLILCTVFLAPYTLSSSSLSSMVPVIAFLYIAAIGQTLVIMTGGIDLSVPSLIVVGSVMMVKVSGRGEASTLLALLSPLGLAAAVGMVNGLLVALFRLNPLVVTLAVGAVVTGLTHLEYASLPPECGVPQALAVWAGKKLLIFNHFSFLAVGLGAFFALAMNHTTVGRRFVAAGTNPNAAKLVGIPVKNYQIAAYTVAGLLYGLTGVLITAFVQAPNVNIGNPYLLSTIVVVVLGGASLGGGPASMIAGFGGAIFVSLLNQMLRAQGFSTSIQFLTQGIVLACAMGMANLQLEHFGRLIPVGSRSRHPEESQ